jgi:Mg-chelatase subunit ChlD/sugar lactone lactonase YvrE
MAVVLLALPAPHAGRAAAGTYVVVNTWQTAGSGLPADAWPAASGVAFDATGRVYVADARTARISVIEADGRARLFGSPTIPLGLVEPHHLAVDSARSRLYVADPGAQAVIVADLDGTRQDAWTGLPGVAGVAVGPDGTVFAALADRGEVERFSPEGERQVPLRVVEESGRGLLGPLDVAADGTLAVLDGRRLRVHLFDAQGRRATPFDLPERVTDVAADFSLGLFTRRWYWFGTADGVLRYDPSREVWERNPVGALSSLAVDPRHGLVASSTGLGRSPSQVLRFPYGVLAGPAAQAWGGPIDVVGLLERPEAIQLGADQRAYVLDLGDRIQRFALGGRALNQIGYPHPLAADATADGMLYVTGGQQLAAFSPAGIRFWEVPVGLAGATQVGGLVVDTASNEIVILDSTPGVEPAVLRHYGRNGAPGRVVPLPDGSATPRVWADLASDGAGSRYALDRRGPAVAVVGPGDAVRLIPLPLPARRLAVGPDGVLFLLGRDGWVRRYDGQGQRLGAFPVTRPDLNPLSAPSDLAVGPDGDVYVTDRAAQVVSHFRWDPDATQPEAPEEGTCHGTPDKTAEPAEVTLGETVTVRLAVQGACSATVTTVPLEVLLVIDRSGSMEGEKIAIARSAAADFISQVDLAESRVGLVSFADGASVDVGLTASEALLRRALAGLTAGGGTRIDLGLAAARAELGLRGNPGSRAVVILLSDGESDAPSALQEAQRVKADGTEIFTIGIQANEVLMRALATDPNHYYAPEAARYLYDVFNRIAERIVADVLYRRAEIRDEIPANMRFVPGSAVPPAVLEGRTLRWQLANVPFSGTTLQYALEPLEPGDWPTNVVAWGETVDGFGQPGRITFPVPRVRVRAPTPSPPTATATATRPSPATVPPMATATATARPSGPPGPIFLPLALREQCTPGQQHADVVLVIDTSESMAGEKLAAARHAAEGFLHLLDLTQDQAGVVAFHTEALLLSPLTGDRARLAAALSRLATRPGTQIDLGLTRAVYELLSPRRHPANTPVIVLLTDGRQSGDPTIALAVAAEARVMGLRLYAIGLGDDVDAPFLQQVAGSPARTYLAPTPGELASLYAEIAYAIPCPPEAFWGGRRGGG